VWHRGARRFHLAIQVDGSLLWSDSFTPIAGMAEEPKNSPVLAVGVLLIFIGLFAFIAVLVRPA
jgi:hypothetical protein